MDRSTDPSLLMELAHYNPIYESSKGPQGAIAKEKPSICDHAVGCDVFWKVGWLDVWSPHFHDDVLACVQGSLRSYGSCGP